MKILICGDEHITNKKPTNRTDDYFNTVMGKLKQQFTIANEESCKCVILPGDLFNTHKESHLVVQCVINLIKEHRIFVLCVAGQHDQLYHNADLEGTTLGTLLTHEDLVFLLSKEPYCFSEGVAIYGASWNEEIPEIVTPDKLNILVLHKMIVDDKLWESQEDFTWANHILMKYKFDLIVSGDNHKQFTAHIGNKWLLNMGSMMRSTIDQINHKPAVAVYNTTTKDVEIIDLFIKPFEKVMDVNKANTQKERKHQLDGFIASLKGETSEDSIILTKETGKNLFLSELDKYIKDNEIFENISSIIYGVING